jgi:hypothetical protein
MYSYNRYSIFHIIKYMVVHNSEGNGTLEGDATTNTIFSFKSR